MHIDISLTAISPRRGSLGAVLTSLLDQSLPPARVVLHLSDGPYLLDHGFDALPAEVEALLSDPRLVVEWVENTGSYRKILPWLARPAAPYVVTADDDTLYPRHWLETLAEGRARHPQAVVAWSAHAMPLQGRRLAPYRAWFGEALPPHPAMRLLPVGKNGVLYAATDFPPEVQDISTAKTLARTADDLWLRWHVARRGHPVAVVGQGQSLPEVAPPSQSLWRDYNRGGGNQVVVRALEDYFAARWGMRMAALD